MSTKYDEVFKPRPKVMILARAIIDDYLKSALQDKKSEFLVLSAADFDGHPEFENKYLTEYMVNYTSNFPTAKAEKEYIADPEGVTARIHEEVPARIMMRQMMAAEDFFFGYNIQNGALNLYTADERRLSAIDAAHGETPTRNIFKTSDFYKKNVEGIIHAKRIDVTYNTPEDFELKAVSLTSASAVNMEHMEIIPFFVMNRIYAMVKTLLKSGRVLNIVQDYKGTVKDRYVSTSPEILSAFTDNESFARLLKPFYYELKAFMYLPVLGAPSTTVGVSRVDIVNIEQLHPADKNQIPVVPAVNPKGSLAQGQVLEEYIGSLYGDVTKTAELQKVLQWMMYGGVDIPDKPSVGQMKSIVRRIDKHLADQMMDRLPPEFKELTKKIEVLFEKQVFVPNAATSADLRSLLREHLTRMVIINKTGTFSVIYATNNERYLKFAYGDDYQRRFEGEGFRKSQVAMAIRAGEDELEAAAAMGVVLPLDRSGGQDRDGYRQFLLRELEDGQAPFTPNSDPDEDAPVTARGLFAAEKKPGEPSSYGSLFYRKITPSRVFSTMILK